MNKSTTIKLFASELFAQSIAIYSLFTIMFSERGGLSTSQVGFILATYSVTVLLLEVPTGAIADRFSRKWSMVIARLFLASGMLLWLLFPSFYGYIAGMVLMGVSESLMSGALQAYLYESLGSKSNQFARYNSRLWATMMTGFMIGAGLAFLIGANYTVLLALSAVFPLISVAILLTLPSDTISKTAHKNMLAPIRGALSYIKGSKKVLYAVMSIVCMKLLVDVLIEYTPLYYKAAGSATKYIPLLLLGGNLLTVVLLWNSHTILRYIKRVEFLVGLVLLGMLVVTRYAGTAAAIGGMFLFVRYGRIVFVHLESEFQHLAVNTYRATLGSLYSMASRLLGAAAFIVIGYFAKQSSLLTPVVVFSCIVYAAYAVTRIASKKHQ